MILYNKVDDEIASVEVMGKLLDYNVEIFTNDFVIDGIDILTKEYMFTKYGKSRERYAICFFMENNRIYDVYVTDYKNSISYEDYLKVKHLYERRRPTRLQVLEAIRIMLELLK